MNLLYENLLAFTPQHIIMILVGVVLLVLAIKKEMEPTLLLPMGFGTILVNVPLADVITEHGALTTLYNAGIANELFPLLLFQFTGFFSFCFFCLLTHNNNFLSVSCLPAL